ncbi:MAG: endonuclease/exonuclease/phosphatase family protein [Clostridia bacterium]|nr:endonuclease/exonuclease/phosphatase family protein [Clostridia bacterium]
MHNDNNVMLKEKGVCGIVPRYAHDAVTINGIRLSDYRIVYPAQTSGFEKTVAEMLSARIFDLTEDSVPFLADCEATSAHKIMLHQDQSLECGMIVLEDGIELCGKSAYHLGIVAKELLDRIEDVMIRGDGKIDVAGKTDVPEKRSISLMAYNFYGFHAYQSRMDNICRVITKYLPDVLSIQEPDLAMMELTHINLDGYYEYYNGRPRHGEDENNLPADAKGANSVAPILYNKKRFHLLSADTRWMSDTPEDPSKYENSVYYRHYSYAVLEDLFTKERFVAVNLHLQRSVAVEQVKIVLEHLNRCFNDLPIFLIGDFNSEIDKPVLEMLLQSAGFASTHNTAKKIRDGHNRIDWILYTKDCAEADFYHCCTETYPDPDDKKGYYHGKTPSDHFAYYAEITVDHSRKILHDWSDTLLWEPEPIEAT